MSVNDFGRLAIEGLYPCVCVLLIAKRTGGRERTDYVGISLSTGGINNEVRMWRWGEEEI